MILSILTSPISMSYMKYSWRYGPFFPYQWIIGTFFWLTVSSNSNSLILTIFKVPLSSYLLNYHLVLCTQILNQLKNLHPTVILEPLFPNDTENSLLTKTFEHPVCIRKTPFKTSPIIQQVLYMDPNTAHFTCHNIEPLCFYLCWPVGSLDEITWWYNLFCQTIFNHVWPSE